MYSQILPNYYFDETIFEKEKDYIFHNNWMFVCFKQDVANINDFITVKLGRIPVVVQNMNGEVKAFMNVCSHRFSILQTQEKGNRALFCPYHGWAFNKDGIPTGIPKKPLFKDFNEQELCDLKLNEYPIQQCGDLLFVHINKPKKTLEEYLGAFYTELEQISKCKDVLVDVNRINIKANWKVVVENTLESYHVNLVHTETFKRLGAKGLDFNFADPHSSWEAELNLSEDDIKLSKIRDLFKDRSYSLDGYKHYLIYPNLLVSTSYGTSYNFSIINPVSPGETSFTSLVFTATPAKQNSVFNIFKDSLIEFNRQVFDEDQAICEEVQKGVVVTNKQGVLSLEEKRVHSFQENYINQLT
jgi:phenylpropionate dioxygenase-like ring-hydroxylating dioxygenase large terminal subunit